MRTPKNLEQQSRLTRLVQIKLPTDALRLGMHVVELDRPWTELPVLFQGMVIETEQQLAILRHYCLWVIVELSQSYVDKNPSLSQQFDTPRYRQLPERVTIERELPRARRAYYQAKDYIGRLLSEVEKGSALSLDEARPVVQQCVTSILANANAMFWLNRIKNEDVYTAEHCLRVGIMAIAFGRFLNMAKDNLEVLGVCGLLHDIGKVRVPAEILNKPGALDPDEFRLMQKHTEFGHAMLSAHHKLEPIVSDTALTHHERLDGNGYPNGHHARSISRFARIIAIVDAYDAITSDRCYRRGRSPADALRILYQERSAHFDPELTEAFIRMIGIYPPGSLVELDSGEVAVIIATNPNHKLRPKIELLLDSRKRPCASRVIDLAAVADNEAPPTIKQAIADGAYGFSLEARIENHIKAAQYHSAPTEDTP